MSVSSEVQRTLVKSPPELWAELSDPTALARHLGELGEEVRITRVEPEKTVEWEAADASGMVRLKPSGWGTKVTLTATRELPAPEPVADEPMVIPEPEPIAAEPVPMPEPFPTVGEQPEVAVQPEPEPEPRLEPRRGLFARLFRRRREWTVEVESESVESESVESTSVGSESVESTSVGSEFVEVESVESESESVESESESVESESEQPEAIEIAEPGSEPTPVLPEEVPDISAELQAAEEVAAEQVTAVLTTVLDRLGAAHHRPFSRS
jgi:hypothetical protein